jgi:REP element-mobilizing transposase RayT
MSHSFVSNLLHCTFSTKERYPFIDSDLEARLWPYVGGIARENRMTALAIGGTADHLHALLSLPGMMSFAKAVQLIKAGPPSGSMIRFQVRRNLPGRKDTVLLV